MLRLPCALLLALSTSAFMQANAADSVGIFSFSRKSYDPTSPQPAAVARDDTIESAALASGDASAGRINVAEWSGDNQAGGRGVGGVNLALPAGTNAYLGLVKDWSLSEGVLSGAVWQYYTKSQQDALMVSGFADADPAAINLAHGAGFGLDGAQPYARVLFVLPWRWVLAGGSSFQTGAYNGNPPEAGLWAVPAGVNLAAVQTNPATYQLAGLDSILNQIQPHMNSLSFKVQLLGGGHWQVAIDINDDGTADVITDDAQTGNRISPFAAMTERSGLLFSSRAAMGSKTGTVGRTSFGVSYRVSPTTPLALADRRPLTGQIPEFSQTSPARIFGQQWSTAFVVSATSDNGPVASVPVSNYSNGFFASLDLRSDRAPTHITLSQSGTPATLLVGSTSWQETSIYNGGSTVIRAGESLLFSYAPSCGPEMVKIDANGDGVWDYTGDGLSGFPYQFTTPGQYVAKAQTAGNAGVTDTFTVNVVSVNFDGPIACQVGFQREKGVEINGIPASSVFFTAKDPSLLSVSVKETTPFGVRLFLKPLGRGTPVVQARSGSPTGPILAEQEIDEYTLENTASTSVVVGSSGLGNGQLVIHPFIPSLTANFAMFASTSSFNGGKFIASSTDAWVQSVDSTGETIGTYNFSIVIPPAESRYCFKVGMDQHSKYGTLTGEIGNNGDTIVLTLNPDPDRIVFRKTFDFTVQAIAKADPAKAIPFKDVTFTRSRKAGTTSGNVTIPTASTTWSGTTPDTTVITVTGSEQTNRDGGQNVLFNVNHGGAVIAFSDFCVSSRPINYRQTAGIDAGGGILHFEYKWDSDSGILGDLQEVDVGEKVDYPGVFPNPPFGSAAPNPTIRNAAGIIGAGEDNHGVPGPLTKVAGSIDGTQLYRFRDKRFDSSFINLMGPITISRRVTLLPSGAGQYQITKSGVTATLAIP